MVLLKSLKLLRSGMEDVPPAVTYAGEKDYTEMKRRMEEIAGFRPYRKKLCVCMVFSVFLLIMIALVAVHNHSYMRCNESHDIMVGKYGVKNEIVSCDIEELSEMISYDDEFVYVEREAFDDFLCQNNVEGDICIVFGGFYKLPGLGGAAEICYYERNSKDALVQIPYERMKENWYIKLFKML